MLSKNKKENMTMLKLGQMTTKGFLELGKKIDKIEKRMDVFEKRMDQIEEQIKISGDSLIDVRITMDRRLNSMEEKIEKGVDRMLTVADHMTKEFSIWKQENAFGAGIESRQDDELKDHEKRIVKIEQKLEV